MLYDPARHEPLRPVAWDESRARTAIARVVADTEAAFVPATGWPLHPNDADDGDTTPAYPLYHGAAGVIWALTYLQAIGAATLKRDYAPCVEALRARNAAWLASFDGNAASLMMGDLGYLMLAFGMHADDATRMRLDALIAANIDHPARELMWGAPGTMLAALFLHERTGDARWAERYVATAQKLRSQLVRSDAFGCEYWTQDLYGTCSTYLDAVHGFVATALPLIHGRHLLAPDAWREWSATIANTVRATASREGGRANWRAWLIEPPRAPMLMQFCHGAPGFVICLADMPGSDLDDLLQEAGEATWEAGPLAKGANLCHGTAGNGYAFLKLYARTGDARWLTRARAFAAHAIEQMDEAAQRTGRLRYSLYTGDPGVAVYVADCISGTARFPTLDVFYGTA